MAVSFTLSAYAPKDTMPVDAVQRFTIEPAALDYGTNGIADALADCVEAGTVIGWPDGLDPKSKTLGRFDLESQYKALSEDLKAAIEFQREFPGSFSGACFWVQVNL